MTGYTVSPGMLVSIEQAVARGESLDRICRTLRVSPPVVDRVLARMDAAVAEDKPGAA